MNPGYFADLDFVTVGISGPTATAVCERRFEGYYGIQYVFEGEIYVRVNGHPVEYGVAPVVFVTWPGVCFSYGSPGGKLRRQAHICFRGGRVRRYLESGLLEVRERNLFTPIVFNVPFLSAVREVVGLLQRPDFSRQARAVLKLEDLLLQLREQPAGGRGMLPQVAGFDRLCEAIASDPGRDWNFEAEAAALGFSYVHFRRRFREITGWSPGQYLLECRLRRAEKLLTGSRLRVSEIAWACGFRDPDHFSRIFHKHRIVAPIRLRELYGQSE